MSTALERMNRLASHGGPDLMETLANTAFGILVFVLILFFITTELWIFSIKSARNGSIQARFWQYFLPLPLFAITIRLLGPDIWAGAIGWGEPMLANLALAGFDIPDAPMLDDTTSFQSALAYVVSGRAGQILLPSALLSLTGYILIKTAWPSFKNNQGGRIRILIGAMLLFTFFPPLLNKPIWSAWLGNTAAYESQITTPQTRPLSTP